MTSETGRRRGGGGGWYEEYHPYGTTAWQAADSSITARKKRYRYTQKERDAWTGLSYHGARYYMPWLGRWESADPSGIRDGVNRYAYVRGNPVSGRDPSGMGTDDPQHPDEQSATLGPRESKRFLSEEDLQTLRDTKAVPESEQRPPDIVIIFTGGIEGGGHDIPVEDALASGTLRRAIQQQAKETGKPTPRIDLIEPGVTAAAVKNAMEFITANREPGSRVVIQGFSRGGIAALNLARELDEEDITVDLLVTVDVALGPLSEDINRVVPSNVDINLNFFQTTPSRIMSRGDAAVPSLAGQDVLNKKVTGLDVGRKPGEPSLAHGLMNARTVGTTSELINAFLFSDVSRTEFLDLARARGFERASLPTPTFRPKGSFAPPPRP